MAEKDNYDYWRKILVWWAVVLIVAVFVLAAAGCAKIRFGEVEYSRVGNQRFDDVLIEVIEPNGKRINVIIGGQKSDMQLALEAAGIGAKMGGEK